jgi:hypothetical protein
MRSPTARLRRAHPATPRASLWLLAGLLIASCLQSPDTDLFTPSAPSISPGVNPSLPGGGSAAATGGTQSARGGDAASPGDADEGGAPAHGGETSEPPRGGSSSAGTGGSGSTGGSAGSAGTSQAGTNAGGSGGTPDTGTPCSELPGVVVSATGHCYRGSEEELGFAEAHAACVAEGGYLVTIGSAEENELVEEILAGENWIGATDRRDSRVPGAGTYQWVTEEPFVYSNWYPGQPNALGAECPSAGNDDDDDDDCYEHCAAMRNDGAWNDRACWEELSFVCEWDPLPSGPRILATTDVQTLDKWIHRAAAITSAEASFD